ncbi:MAG: hypothetical protein ACLFUY_03305 [Desulfobacterales bacterium]
MDKVDFQDRICRPFCMFFVEGEKEEMACLGARVAQRLLVAGRIDAAHVNAAVKSRSVWEARRQDLGEVLCGKCEFRAEDCDFQSPQPADDLEPCGGYIVLAHLLENRRIQTADIKDVL